MGIVRPRVLIGVPLGITQVESRAFVKRHQQAGGQGAFIIEEPVAAAMDLELGYEPIGHMVVDMEVDYRSSHYLLRRNCVGNLRVVV